MNMPITHIRTRATATIPTQQYGNVTLEIELVYEPQEHEVGIGNRAIEQVEDVHHALVNHVRETMDRSNPNVAAWLKANSTG